MCPGFASRKSGHFIHECRKNTDFFEQKYQLWFLFHALTLPRAYPSSLPIGQRQWDLWMALTQLFLFSAYKKNLPSAVVIVVDWSKLAQPTGDLLTGYMEALPNVVIVGYYVGQFLVELGRQRGKLSLRNVHVIGFSLGAHVAGYAAIFLKSKHGLTLERITGECLLCSCPRKHYQLSRFVADTGHPASGRIHWGYYWLSRPRFGTTALRKLDWSANNMLECFSKNSPHEDRADFPAPLPHGPHTFSILSSSSLSSWVPHKIHGPHSFLKPQGHLKYKISA